MKHQELNILLYLLWCFVFYCDGVILSASLVSNDNDMAVVTLDLKGNIPGTTVSFSGIHDIDTVAIYNEREDEIVYMFLP